VLSKARESQDRWLRLAEVGREGGGDSSPTQEEEIMERLLALRSVPLFAHLSLEQLEAISRFVNEVQYLAGEVVVREGDPGDELFVLLEGEVQAFKSYGTSEETLLSTTVAVGYTGEMAILDDAPRSATVIASRDSRLLTLAGDRFKELVMQAPEISFEMFRVLTARIRSAEGRNRG
jgi:CRP-like cAMP-binding protein